MARREILLWCRELRRAMRTPERPLPEPRYRIVMVRPPEAGSRPAWRGAGDRWCAAARELLEGRSNG